MRTPDNQEILKTVIEESHTPIALYVGRELIVTVANAAMIKAWGKEPGVIGKPLHEAVPELDGQPFLDILQKQFDTGELYEAREALVILLIDNERRVFYFDFTYKPLKNEQGEVWAILNNASDVTELVEARRKIADNEQRFRKMVEESPVAIGVLRGPDHIVEICNRKMQQLWRKTDQVLNKRFIDALPEMQDQPFPAMLDAVMQTGKAYYGSEVMARLEEDGEMRERYFNFIYEPQKDDNDDITGIIMVASEVTEQVCARHELQESERRFRALIEDAPMATALFEGPDKVVKIANKQMFHMWGKDEQVLGKKLIDAVPELINQPFLQILDNVFNSGMAYHADQQLAYLHVNGELRPYWFNFTYQPLFNEEGQVYAVLDMAVDVSRQVNLQKQKDDFLGIASHELKTPVTSLKAYIQVFEMLISQHPQPDKQQKDMVRNMNNQVNKLTSLIEDLLDVTKIQAGRLQFNDAPFNFADMVDEALDDIRYTIGKHDIVRANEASGFVMADKERISQVIANLVSNAVKYSPQADQIVVSTRNVGNEIHFCVQDFGIGIPEDKQERVFEQFYRVSGKMQHTFPGLGLGLYISSEILKHERGRMWVNSTVDQGSTFCFALPVHNTAS